MGLSCYDHENLVLGGACHFVEARSLDNCMLEATATEVWKVKTDSTTQLVHWAVCPKPTANMTFKDLTHHWNYPLLPILEWEKSQATKRLSDEHVVDLIPM